MKKSNTAVVILKEWGLFIIFISIIILSRLYLWSPVKVDGHSMDPTLANGEYLLVLKYQSIDRFDIVVATETDNDGTTKEIVKRVIGMPGDTIQYENDTLYINGKKTDEPYLMIMMTMVCFSENSQLRLKPSLLIVKAALSSTSSFWMMNTCFWVTTGLFPRIVAKSAPSKKNKSRAKLSSASGRCCLLRPIKHIELS